MANKTILGSRLRNTTVSGYIIGRLSAGTGAFERIPLSELGQRIGGNDGTVTSVSMTVPSSLLTVSGSPITGTGTLAVALQTQNANLVFAGPTTGSAAAPTFRSLVAADIPSLSGTYQPLANDLTALSSLGGGNGLFARISSTSWVPRTIGASGNGLSIINASGAGGDPTISMAVASSSVFGTVKVDGTTITASAGVISAVGGGATGANPTATASDAAVNGSATTFMRSDAAPAIQKTTSGQFGLAKVDGTTITASGGVITAALPTAANPSATASDTAVNGSATTFMRSDAAPAIQKGSATQFGVVEVDGTTITASGGVISAVGSSGGMTLISDTTTTGSAASVTISSISGGYKDLILVVTGASGGAVTNDGVLLQFNGDTGSNYDWMRVTMSGTNNSTSNTSGAGATQAQAGLLVGTSGTTHYSETNEITIGNYAATTFYKSFKSNGGGAVAGTTANILSIMHGGIWRSTAAINAIKVFLTTGPFADGTRISLYGRA